MKMINLAALPFTFLAAAVMLGGCAGEGLPDETSPNDNIVSVGEPGSGKAVTETPNEAVTETPDESEEHVASASLALTSQSWQWSCDAARYYYTSSGYWYRLDAHCRTRSGSWRWSTYWYPLSCSGDLANCNGYLHCGPC